MEEHTSEEDAPVTVLLAPECCASPDQSENLQKRSDRDNRRTMDKRRRKQQDPAEKLPGWWETIPSKTQGKARPATLAPNPLAKEEGERVRQQVLVEKATTLLVRNVPYRVVRAEFLERLDEAGFAGSYDLVFLPFDLQSLKWKGYVFVNFCTPADAARFCLAASDIRIAGQHSILEPSISKTQGYLDTLARIEQSLNVITPPIPSWILDVAVLARTGDGMETMSAQRATGLVVDPEETIEV
jgi:hypothetical protein